MPGFLTTTQISEHGNVGTICNTGPSHTDITVTSRTRIPA